MNDLSPPSGEPSNDFLRDATSILVLSLAPAIGLGMARFAYALVLPSMAFGPRLVLHGSWLAERQQRRRLSARGPVLRTNCREIRSISDYGSWCLGLCRSATSLRSNGAANPAQRGAWDCRPRRRVCLRRRRRSRGAHRTEQSGAGRIPAGAVLRRTGARDLSVGCHGPIRARVQQRVRMENCLGNPLRGRLSCSL